MQRNSNQIRAAVIAALAGLAGNHVATAQQSTGTPASGELEQIIVTGTRVENRSAKVGYFASAPQFPSCKMREPELSGAFGTLMGWADAERRIERQVGDSREDSEEQPHRDPGQGARVEQRAVRGGDHQQHREAGQLGPGEHADAADPARREGPGEVGHAPRQRREETEAETAGHRRSLGMPEGGREHVACYTLPPVDPN